MWLKAKVVVFGAVALLAVATSALGQGKPKPVDQVSDDQSIRYVIAFDHVDPRLSKEDLDRRIVEIVIDEKSFSERALIRVFQLLSKRFPSPDLLFINVYTSLYDIETPEEREMGKTSESKEVTRQIGNFAEATRTEGMITYSLQFKNDDFLEGTIELPR